jgi:hypothetical protein
VDFQSIVEWVLLNGREREERGGGGKEMCILNAGGVHIVHMHQTEPFVCLHCPFLYGETLRMYI